MTRNPKVGPTNKSLGEDIVPSDWRRMPSWNGLEVTMLPRSQKVWRMRFLSNHSSFSQPQIYSRMTEDVVSRKCNFCGPSLARGHDPIGSARALLTTSYCAEIPSAVDNPFCPGPS